MKKAILVITAMFGFTQFCMAQEYEYDKAVEMARIGDGQIQSVTGRFTYGTEEPIRSVKYKYDHASGRLSVCVEQINGNEPYLKFTKSYDGQKTTTYSQAMSENGKMNHTAFINNESLENPVVTPFIFGYYLFRKNISDVLSSRTIWTNASTCGGLEYSRTEKIDGLDVDVFSVVIENKTSCELYLAPQYLYRPVKLTFKDGDGKILVDASCRYKEIESGVYFPDEVVLKELDYDAMTIDYITEETSVNVPLSIADFEIDIPDDVKVADHR